MIVFEDELARIVDILPKLVDAKNNEFSIKFNWGSENILAKYLSLNKKNSFPLIWLEEGEDTHNIVSNTSQTVSRNARIIILSETKAPSEFNPYQYQYDFKLILQPIADNLLIALQNSGISHIDPSSVRTQRITKYAMRQENKSLLFICNAIVINVNITFNNFTTCINKNNF